MKGSWDKLRSRGFKRCVFTIVQPQKGNRKSSATMNKKGDRCRQFASPSQVAERGLPICTQHWPVFQEQVTEDARRRSSLRAKYDPGPLPLDD